MNPTNRTKIIGTLGPSTNSPEALRALREAGMDMIRLNGAHGSPEWHTAAIAMAREVLPGAPILLDIPGRKIRIGKLEAPLGVARGDLVALRGTGAGRSDGNSRDGVHDENRGAMRIPVTCRSFHQDVSVGNAVVVDDTGVRMAVRAVEGGDVVCEVLAGGILLTGKGIHFPGVTMRAELLSQRDKKLVSFAIQQEVDYVGISFVSHGSDIDAVRHLISRAAPRIIAKVETQAAVDHLEGILEKADGIMVDRGDLSAETSFDRVGFLQKSILAAARRAACPVIVATEMLHTMIEHPLPSKAEICDMTNAVLDGASALMLSGETAIGKYPVEAVGFMRRVADSAHAHMNLASEDLGKIEEVSQAVGEAIAAMCRRLDITKIVAITVSGYAARMIAAQSPRQPILAVSNDAQTARALNFLQGTRGVFLDLPFSRTNTDHIPCCLERLWRGGELEDQDLILVTAVSYPKSGNRMNLIQTHKVGDLRESLRWER